MPLLQVTSTLAEINSYFGSQSTAKTSPWATTVDVGAVSLADSKITLPLLTCGTTHGALKVLTSKFGYSFIDPKRL